MIPEIHRREFLHGSVISVATSTSSAALPAVVDQHFPEEESPIAAVEAQVTPFIDSLKIFRNRLGFHGSRLWSHEAPGFDLFAKHSGTETWDAMLNFRRLSTALLTKDLQRQKVRS